MGSLDAPLLIAGTLLQADVTMTVACTRGPLGSSWHLLRSRRSQQWTMMYSRCKLRMKGSTKSKSPCESEPIGLRIEQSFCG
jgi:hypothetical protein